MSFTRKIENFACEQCGAHVTGNGYTNHCPACLWSKHLDESPGDRAAVCGGAMEPVAVETKGGRHTITHRCVRCVFERRQKADPSDNPARLIELSASQCKQVYFSILQNIEMN